MRRQKGNRLLFPVFEKKDACKKGDSKKKGQLLFSVFGRKKGQLLFSVFEKNACPLFGILKKSKKP